MLDQQQTSFKSWKSIWKCANKWSRIKQILPTPLKPMFHLLSDYPAPLIFLSALQRVLYVLKHAKTQCSRCFEMFQALFGQSTTAFALPTRHARLSSLSSGSWSYDSLPPQRWKSEHLGKISRESQGGNNMERRLGENIRREYIERERERISGENIWESLRISFELRMCHNLLHNAQVDSDTTSIV